MRHFLGISFGLAALLAATAFGQQPQTHTGAVAPNPALRRPQFRSGIGGKRSPAYRAQSARTTRATRTTQVAHPPVAGTTRPHPPAPPPAATPAPTPAPTPVSLKPISPSEMPPVPPQVTFRDGLLTVQAVNSTMGSLLQTIRNKTGIQFEGAGDAAERVAISAGPGPEGEVLADIFNGSKYDYVVIGRSDDPNIVQRVVLTPRGHPDTQAFAPPPKPKVQEPDEEVPDDEADPDQPEDTPVEPPQVTPPPTADNRPKSPQELLNELKQMQEKEKQQKGQPPANQIPAPKKPFPPQ